MNKENKPITIEIADIYLRFPEIMEEECDDLFEFLDDEHIVYKGATDIFYDMQQENTNLKQALNEIRECVNNHRFYDGITEEPYFLRERTSGKIILQIINKVLGDDEK